MNPYRCISASRSSLFLSCSRCDKCGEGFTGTWALKTHMLVHGVEKPFMCDLCGKTFFYNCQLQKHQQLVHDNKDKVGGVPGRRRPTGVKPFSCKICLKSFSSNTTLRTHEKSHAENKEFTCDTCGKSFHLRHLYLYHMRQHSGDRPYVCSVCEKGFLLMSQLKQHELLHTGVKPHKCEQCGKEFRTPQNYHRHLLVHTGEKPYECVVCSRKFRQRVGVIELKAAPEDVTTLAYGRLLVAAEHLFPGRRKGNSASFNIAHQFTVKGERDGEQGLWQSPPEPPSPHLQEIAG